MTRLHPPCSFKQGDLFNYFRKPQMEIIDNANLKSASDNSIDPWLETLLQKCKTIADRATRDHGFVLRLQARHRARSITYRLENSQNKTCANICRRGDKVKVEILRRGVPDPESGIKPAFELVEAHMVDKTPEGLGKAAQAVYDVLGQATPYSEGRITKIKVHHRAPEDNPWSFTGGQIIGIINDVDNDKWKLMVREGVTYDIQKPKLPMLTPELMQYVVMNGRGGVELVAETEFDFYFVMGHD